jgi:hypothetical protein
MRTRTDFREPDLVALHEELDTEQPGAAQRSRDLLGDLARALRLAAVCTIGGCVYFAALALFGFRVKDFSRRVAS